MHFLRALRKAVAEGQIKSAPINSLYLLYPGGEPGLHLGFRLPGSPLLNAQILIYGSRPVRYQIAIDEVAWSGRTTALWNFLLGPLNLVEGKSGERGGRLQLFYEVTYPEAFLKRLGE